MKSIVEEASSIGKAIEEAWSRAGKPINFSVKIFEEARRNMFGLTVQSAKIGLFFDGKAGASTPYQPPKEQRQAALPREPQQQQPVATPQKPKRIAWSSDMVDSAKEWIQQTLTIIGLPHIQFSVTVSGNLAKFSFPNYVTGKESSDRMLFSSFAHLMMTALRQKYKKSLHHVKIVLTSG
jgi:hypothetical protein